MSLGCPGRSDADFCFDIPDVHIDHNPQQGIGRGRDLGAWRAVHLDRTLEELLRGRPRPSRRRYDLVIGGAGFIGSNLAARLAHAKRRVLVFDNLSRRGTERNLTWLLTRYPSQVDVLLGDLRDRSAVEQAVTGAHTIYHFAAQVAVTTSLIQPLLDHEVNTRGTLNVLEAMRHRPEPPALVFTSTNKVYGALEDVALRTGQPGYEAVDDQLRKHGISESRPLSFSSPYGCSKGAADQYVLDYARTFSVPTMVLRMSCIYGPRQFGNEDQGWVAHFVRQALHGEAITFYGDGLQVRDVLYVEDLLNALQTARAHLPNLAGEAFNIGGGPKHVLSLHSLVERLARLLGQRPAVRMEDWRPSDQRYYVSDTRKFQRATGWQPRVGIDEGLRRLCDWMRYEIDATPQKIGAPDAGRVAP